MNRGFSAKETWLGCGVFLVAVAILAIFALLSFRKRSADVDAAKMSRVYAALAMYQSLSDGVPAPNLASLDSVTVNSEDLIASGDPYAAAQGPFPLDGGSIDMQRGGRRRISFAYAAAHGDALSRVQREATRNLVAGVLADEWIGSVTPLGNFDAEVEGPVLRITADGSAYTSTPRGRKHIGDVDDLFFRR